MTTPCVICNKPIGEDGKTFTLTEEESRLIYPDGSGQSEVSYCKSCLRVMQDREAGASLLKGLYEMELRKLGVTNAKLLSERFLAKLLKATAKKAH